MSLVAYAAQLWGLSRADAAQALVDSGSDLELALACLYAATSKPPKDSLILIENLGRVASNVSPIPGSTDLERSLVAEWRQEGCRNVRWGDRPGPMVCEKLVLHLRSTMVRSPRHPATLWPRWCTLLQMRPHVYDGASSRHSGRYLAEEPSTVKTFNLARGYPMTQEQPRVHQVDHQPSNSSPASDSQPWWGAVHRISCRYHSACRSWHHLKRLKCTWILLARHSRSVQLSSWSIHGWQ